MTKSYRISKSIAAALIAAAVVICGIALTAMHVSGYDAREEAHGMNYVCDPVTGQSYLIWSDEYTSGTSQEGDWTHDIYYKPVDIDDPQASKDIDKIELIGAAEAQEPASASFTENGDLIVTFEDGNRAGDYTLAQRYGIYRSETKNGKPTGRLVAVREYDPDNTTVRMGGHSGHASSTDSRHVVFYSEGWINGGGVDGLGTGDDVRVCSMSPTGTDIMQRKVAVGDRTRDWWPITASSSDSSILVWQRYVKDETYSHLCFAIYDPDTNSIKARTVKNRIRMKYYSYNVVYLQDIDRYVISLTQANGEGTLMVVDENGKVTAEKTGFLSFVREASPAVDIDDDDAAVLCYPQGTRNIGFYRIGKKSIVCLGTRNAGVKWSYRGTSGFFDSDNSHVTFATLGRTKAEIHIYDVPFQGAL